MRFQDPDLLKRISKNNIEFKVIAANPYDDSQMDSLINSGIEAHDPKNETIKSLDFFEKNLNLSEVAYVSTYLPHAFFILTSDQLYIQPYMRNVQSTQGLTLLIGKTNGKEGLFERYKKTNEDLFKEPDSKLWSQLKGK
jgi:hypothetical protein